MFIRARTKTTNQLQDLWHLLTTQKYVLNTIVLSGLYKYPDGYLELFMDNCHKEPELFVMLKTQYKILV